MEKKMWKESPYGSDRAVTKRGDIESVPKRWGVWGDLKGRTVDRGEVLGGGRPMTRRGRKRKAKPEFLMLRTG